MARVRWLTRIDPAAADQLLAGLREHAPWPAGENRATGVLYAPADGIQWPAQLAVAGSLLLYGLETQLGIRFPVVAWQGYRDGAGCGWHADTPFGAQAIVSLGVTRRFGLRPVAAGGVEWLPVAHGDVVVMPDGMQQDWEHCVPAEDVPGDRYSLVCRTLRKEENDG